MFYCLQMPKKCSVPGCKGNYDSNKATGYVSVFRFPTDEETKKLWLKYIPRAEWVPNKDSVVCEKHFDETSISRTEVYKDGEGVTKEISRSRPILLPGAVPRIFPSLPSYLTKPLTPARTDPEVRRSKICEEKEKRAQQLKNEDLIKNFSDLCSNCNKLLLGNTWKIELKDDKIFFYIVDFLDIPKVSVSVQVNDKMVVCVFMNGYIILQEELKDILPQSMKLERWSQLQCVLNKYGDCNEHIVSPNSVVETIKRSIILLRNIIVDADQDLGKRLLFLLEQIELCVTKKRRYSVNMLI